MKRHHVVVTLCACLAGFVSCFGQRQMIDSAMHNVRNGTSREWTEFPAEIKNSELSIRFISHANKSDYALSLRQYDVKLDWHVSVNGRNVGSLVNDENEMITYLTLPTGTLRNGENELVIACKESISDDVRIGEIKIDPRPVTEVLSESSIEVEVFDKEAGKPLPARITIINEDGILMATLPTTRHDLAIRQGVVYTATGKAVVNLPAGDYRIYAGRGFEYSVDSVAVSLKPGDRRKTTFRIRREVSTEGWVSCDTHIHTFTHSRHGDATIEERAITIAGEGIELPVLTDHNIHVNLAPVADKVGVGSHFTPVVGDELTTAFGHFNLFKLDATANVIDHKVKDWNDVTGRIGETGNDKVVILNHARDVHQGFRPFGPDRHLSSAGVDRDDWQFPANAMEVINSGSQQTNFMNLYNDWFGMLNHGVYLTPVGSSDSHDVSRYIVGQGRTYIYTNDRTPGKIDIDAAIDNFRKGKVMVSLGLLTKILVNGRYIPGDLVPLSNTLTVAVEVLGPSWVTADRVSLFANGVKIREAKIVKHGAVLKWKASWDLELPSHDIFLVALAEGPADRIPFWPIAKPYQPSSPEWTPRLIGSSGAVWIDGDKNKRRDSAHDYAKAIVGAANGDVVKIVKQLNDYDAATAAQVAALLWKQGTNLESPEIKTALNLAKPDVKSAFEKVSGEVKLIH